MIVEVVLFIAKDAEADAVSVVGFDQSGPPVVVVFRRPATGLLFQHIMWCGRRCTATQKRVFRDGCLIPR